MTLAVTQAWVQTHGAQYIGGQVELRQAPEGFLRGEIASLQLEDHQLVITTNWTAIQPSELPHGLQCSRPSEYGWQTAVPTEAMPDPTRFSFLNDQAALNWKSMDPKTEVQLAEYHDYFASPARCAVVILYPATHPRLLPKPSRG